MVLVGVIGFPNDGGSITEGSQMPVKAILGNIEFRINEPFYFRFFEIPL